VLSCRAQNNPILVGEPGVGKAAILKGLALATVRPDCPNGLRGRRLIAFNLAHMVLATKDYGQIEEAVRQVLGEVRTANDVILALNDLSTLIGVGKGQAVHYASNVLRSGLAHREIQCIAIATPDQYRTRIETDAVLGRHFQPIFVRPPTRQE